MSRWLRLMVFDLDCTLWPFHVDMFMYSPPFKRKNGQVVDSHGSTMQPYPETLKVLEHWSKKCDIAVASRTTYPQGAESLLKLFGMDKFIKYKQIYPGCKLTHFKKLKEQSGFEYSEMLFFDDEYRNIKDLRGAGVESVHIDPDVGVTMQLIDDIVSKKFHGVKLN
uniref:Magnesium-dependent phosphatase 1 n=1 Tax=Aceria tosichella TaxID=561515 RepID=A0A6G1S3K7_9ACAR